MVSFIKSKGTSFINKPVGVARVDTGSVQAGQQLANLGQNLANSYFAEATKKEQEKGEDYVAKLPVRDADGNLQFKEISGLSAVATQTAKPLLRRKYGNALAVDLQANIQKIRLKYENQNNPEGFQDEARRFVGEYIDVINKQGGSEYSSFIQDGSSKYIVQNFNDLSLKKINSERETALFNSVKVIDESINDIASQMENLPIDINDSDFKEDLDFAETMMEMNIAEIEDLQTEGLSSTAALNKIAEAKNAISLGLMKNVLKNKSANEVAAIQSQYNIGTTNNVSSEKTKAYVELIKEKFGVKKDVTQIISQTFSDQNSSEAKKAFIKNQTDKLDNENYLEQKKSVASEKAGQLFTNHIQNKGIEIGKLDLSNSENQNKIIEIFNLINSTKDIGEKQNIKGFGAVLATEKELMFNKTRFIDNLIKTSLSQYNIDPNVKNFSDIKTQLKFPNKEMSLDDNSKKFVNDLNALKDKLNDPNFSGYVEASLSGSLVTLKENARANAQTTKNKVIDNQINTDTYVHSEAGSKRINDNFGLSENYFLDGFHNKQNENFKIIDASISKGQIPSSLINGFRKVISGTANEFQAEQMMGLYKKYSQQFRGGVMVNTLLPALKKNEAAILESVSELYQQGVGLQEFAGIKGGPVGVTLNQIINKQKQVFQERKEEYVSKVKSLDVKFSDERDVLRSFGLGMKEVNFFDSYAKILISNGEELDTIKDKVMRYSEQFFLPTNGQVVDAMYSSNTSKSLYSLLRVIPDNKHRELFITEVNGKLPEGVVLFDESFRPERPNLLAMKDFTFRDVTYASYKDVPQILRPDVARAFRQGEFDKKQVDRFAVLVPIEKGAVSMTTSGDVDRPTANVVYQAYEVKNNELVPIFDNKGNLINFDVDSVLDDALPLSGEETE